MARKKFLKEKKQVFSSDAEWWLNREDEPLDVYLHEDAPGDWRISVWGLDDIGMEKSFTDKTEARACFRKIASPVCKASLKALGFNQA
jgi:hypothetical protein